MKVSDLSWSVLAWVGCLLALVSERVVGLPAIFILVWLLLAQQYATRWVLAQGVVVSLGLAAVYGIAWQWAFLILWLGYVLSIWRQSSLNTRGWRNIFIAAVGAWLVGLLQVRSGNLPLLSIAWWWPVFWLGILALLKWRRHV
jgi:hypothetical protein